MIGDGEVLAAGLLTDGAGKPALADAGRPCDQEPMPLADPVAAGELEEQRAVKAALGTEVDIFDLRIMSQPGRTGPGLEAFLAAKRRFLLEQNGNRPVSGPFGFPADT